MSDLIIIDSSDEDPKISSVGNQGGGPALGEWYWVKGGVDHKGNQKPDWLGCAMKVGSNFVEVRSPHSRHDGYSYERVHFDDFWTELRHEPNAPTVLRVEVERWQRESADLMIEVERVTRMLGMTPQGKLNAPAEASAGALMVLSSESDPKAYSKALALAKEKTLPELFEKLKEAHGELAKWLHAPALPTIAKLGDQKALVEEIDDRIFSVSLYAGLVEEIKQVAEGKPAEMLDRLHVMQRMVFMDEECLARYRHGGMEIYDLNEFDRWLAKPENLHRILPFPRTLACFRVRRYSKYRDWEGSLGKLLENAKAEQFDKLTFMYIRNGEQLWRLETELEFDELTFPDASIFNPNEPKMFRKFGDRVEKDSFISRHHWEHMRDTQLEQRRDHEEWAEAHPGEWMNNPHRLESFHRHEDYQPLDPSSVFYDDAMKLIEKQVKKYNRTALIIQGLFDRSLVLHPHPPAKTWTPDGFDAAVKLVYDGTWTLHNGEAPDFEAYRARCNKTLTVGSMTIGQEDAWEIAEAKKEGARRDRDWRNKSEYRPERFRPYGNPGPGYLARVEKWSKTRGATFSWERNRQKDSWKFNDERLPCSVTVKPDKLFNVDAYKPGDFEQFFKDPRTRADYLRWAPMLIAAEEYHQRKEKP